MGDSVAAAAVRLLLKAAMAVAAVFLALVAAVLDLARRS